MKYNNTPLIELLFLILLLGYDRNKKNYNLIKYRYNKKSSYIHIIDISKKYKQVKDTKINDYLDMT